MQRSEMTFEKGSILRKEMLTDLYEYPRIAVESYYASYTDGILYGLEWCDNKNKPGCHMITPGALKFRGEIYFLSRFIDVEESIIEKEVDKKYRLFFIKKREDKEINTRTVYRLELEAVQSSDLENARKNGFYYTYVECNANDEFLVINDEKELYGLFAANDGYTYQLPYYILDKKIRSIIEEKKQKHPLDYQILKELYERKAISVSFVKLYLNEAGVEYRREDLENPVKLLDKFIEACRRLKFEVANVAHYVENASIQEKVNSTIIHEGGSL